MLVWGFLESVFKPKPVVRFVRTATARTGVIERTLRVSGVTAALKYQHVVAPTLQGTRRRDAEELTLVLDYLLPAGARVKKGQIVASFDRQFMLLRLDDYRAEVVQQEAAMRRLQAMLDLRRVQQEQRVRAARAAMEKAALDLRTAPIRSAIQVERYRLMFEEAQAHYRQLLAVTPLVLESEKAAMRREELKLEDDRLELRQAEENAERMVQRAEIDGTLVLRRVRRGSDYTEYREGDSLRPGEIFGEIVDPSVLAVDAVVNQVDLDQVRRGQAARVRFDALPGIELAGHVASVSSVPIPAGQRPSYVREVPIRIELEEKDERIIPNLSASAEIIVESQSDVVIVPTESVLRSADNRPYALVETPDGWERRELELGIQNHVEVAVQKGVKEGERVALEPVAPNR